MIMKTMKAHLQKRHLRWKFNTTFSNVNVTLPSLNVTTEYIQTTEYLSSVETTTKHYDFENITYTYTSLGLDSRIGFGVTIIGEKQRGAREWDVVFWAKDKYKTVEQWFTIENDPSSTANDFTLSVSTEELPDKVLWNMQLLFNGEVKSRISGCTVQPTSEYFRSHMEQGRL